MQEVTYEQIKRANDAMQLTDIKGKAYAEVAQRITAFRMVYPTGYIQTDIIKNDDGVCIFKASVGYVDGEQYITLGTGFSYEKENSSFINKTSYIENCETSAVGRALGMAGFAGTNAGIASAEEVRTAQHNQEQKATAEQVQKIKAHYGERLHVLLAHFNVEKAEDILLADATAVVNKIESEV